MIRLGIQVHHSTGEGAMNVSASVRAVTILLAAVAVVAGCGVSKSKYLSATTSAEEMTAKATALQSSLDAANADNAKLKEQVSGMQSSVDQLNTELAKQKAAVDETKSAYEGMVGQLKGELSSGQVEIQQMRDGVRLNMAQDILFKSGSANLDKEGKELLLKVADELKRQNYQVSVVGHTDNQKIGASLAAKYPTNWELGAARAGAIVKLFQGAGIEPGRLLTVSAGEARPRASNDTPEGRDLNRRIEIRLRPMETESQASN